MTTGDAVTTGIPEGERYLAIMYIGRRGLHAEGATVSEAITRVSRLREDAAGRKVIVLDGWQRDESGAQRCVYDGLVPPSQEPGGDGGSWIGYVTGKMLLGGVSRHESARFATREQASRWCAAILEGNCQAHRFPSAWGQTWSARKPEINAEGM